MISLCLSEEQLEERWAEMVVKGIYLADLFNTGSDDLGCGVRQVVTNTSASRFPRYPCLLSEHVHLLTDV